MKKWLGFIFITGFFLRIFLINSIPPALNWDEASHGYNAYSILDNGRDEWGIKFPVIFKAFGDYKLPVYIYITVLSEFIFGLDALAVRLPSIVFGSLTIIFTYLLANELFNKYKQKQFVGLIAAMLVAIEPWTFFLSRGAFEANVGQSLLVLGIYFILSGLRNRSRVNFNLGLFVLGLSVWTYNSERLFVPLLLIMINIIYRSEILKLFKEKVSRIAPGIIIVLFFVPMLLQLLRPEGVARYGWLSIINDASVGEIIEDRKNCSLTQTACRFIYNRPVYFTSKFIQNYIKHFDPNFLYLSGGGHYQFSLPNHGLLYASGIGFLLAGLVGLVRLNGKHKWLILVWIGLSPIASSLTREDPHALRFITLLPIPMIITAYGLVLLWEKIHSKLKILIFAIYGFLMLIQFSTYMNNYFTKYPIDYDWSWQYGNRELVEYMRHEYHDYDKILITKKLGEPHIFILFYWPWEPSNYLKDPNINRFNQSNWYWVDGFDKFYFINDWDIVLENDFDNKFLLESGKLVDCSNTTCLLFTSPRNAPKNWKKLDEIKDLRGGIVYEVYKN